MSNHASKFDSWLQPDWANSRMSEPRDRLQARITELEAALRALVTDQEGKLPAGVADYDGDQYCIYCDAVGYGTGWRSGQHKPDCPIVAGRKLVDDYTSGE